MAGARLMGALPIVLVYVVALAFLFWVYVMADDQ
jgi:hypothetical protein